MKRDSKTLFILKSQKSRHFFLIACGVFVFFILGFNYRKKTTLHKRVHEENIFSHVIAKKHFPEWMMTQIDSDLSPFKKFGVSKQVIDKALESYLKSDLGPDNHLELARCQIQNGTVSIHGLYPTKKTESRLYVVLQALTKLTHLVPIPDIDFIICVGDSLNPKATSFFTDVPVLCFSKNIQDRSSVLIPDCEALSEGFHERVLADTAYGREYFCWCKKQEKAFWRGATTGTDTAGSYYLSSSNYQEFPRIKLVMLSSLYSHLIDAKLSSLAQIVDPSIYGALAPYVGPSVPVIDHLKYKYQILVDGNTCAYSRAFWQLFSDCLIFKQTSPNIQWYYNCLQPYIHYIPVAYDFSDLVEKIEWAKNHDKEAKKITDTANSFAQENLKKEDVYLYMYLFIHKYAELFQNE